MERELGHSIPFHSIPFRSVSASLVCMDLDCQKSSWPHRAFVARAAQLRAHDAVSFLLAHFLRRLDSFFASWPSFAMLNPLALALTLAAVPALPAVPGCGFVESTGWMCRPSAPSALWPVGLWEG